MNITLVVEYAGRVRWQLPGPWARLICNSLRDRGHDLHIVADCITDTRHFAGATIDQRRPSRKRLQRSPIHFQHWAIDRAQPPSISLSSMVPGSLWCPLDTAWRRELAELASMRSPASLAMEILHRAWIPTLALAQHRAETVARRNGCTLARLGSLCSPPRTVALGFCSSIDPTHLDADNLRQQVRQALAIDARTFVACASASHVAHAGLRDMLCGWRDSARRHSGILLLMARKSALLDRIVGSLQMRDVVRIIGQTERPEAALAAADLAIAWDTSPSSTGRFIADALVMQRPVLAQETCVGSELVKMHDAGRAMRSTSAAAWAEEIERARALAPLNLDVSELSPARLARRLEQLLANR